MSNEKIAKAVVQARGFKLLNAEGEWVKFQRRGHTFIGKATENDTVLIRLPDAEYKEFESTFDAMRWLAQSC